MYNSHRSYAFAIITIIILATKICAVPNYYDPKNIINAQDPFWSFGLTKEGITQLRDFPNARKELWEKIRAHAREFKKYATKRMSEQSTTNPEEVDAYRQASDIIEHAEQEARAILFPIGLNETEIDGLNDIINGTTPEKVLNFDKHTKKLLQQLKTPRMGGSRFHEQVPVRIALEKHYKHRTSFLKHLTERSNLSRKDRTLITRAQESLERAYKAIHQHVSFSE